MEGTTATGSGGAGGAITLPTMAWHLRRMRKLRDMSQQDLADVAGVSMSYIQKLESGHRGHASREFTVAIADALGLHGGDRQALFYLAGLDPVVELPDVRRLREELSPQQWAELDDREPDLLAYFDQRWSLLASNTPFDYAFPGLLEIGNMMLWHFGSLESQQVFLQWQRESLLNVALVRGLLARYYPAPWARDLVSQLALFPDFVAMWHANEGAAYWRDERDRLMYLLDPVTHEPYTLRVELYPISNRGRKIYRWVGVRESEFVPPMTPATTGTRAEPGRR